MSKGRLLLVGGDAALAAELAAGAKGLDVESVPDVRQAGPKLATESYAAVVLDLAKTPALDRDVIVRLHKDRGGFALLGLESQAQLSPSLSASMRRLPWPLPAGFLDQVRAADNPVVFLAEPTLFVTQGMQNALRQAGVQFFQLDAVPPLIDMLKEQVARAETERSKASKPAGLWERLSGSGEAPKTPILGHVVVAKFQGPAAEAAQFDQRLRQALPSAVSYFVSSVDAARSAVAAVAAGQPALLPRELAGRVGEILTAASGAAKSAPRAKERLLLVDSELGAVSRLADALLKLGYEVATGQGDAQAIKLADGGAFDLAAIGGPAETAKRAAQEIRKKHPDMGIILMVDPTPLQDALRGIADAVQAGLDDAILKPVAAERLVISIQRALDSRFLRKENERLRKEAEESARKLAQVNGFQTKFFATVAHDVKNPLTAILGYSEVLGMRLRAMPEELKCASHIHSAAKTLNVLVSDLVDLAAIESGKLRVEIGDLDLASVVAEVKSRVDVVAGRKQLEFTAKFAGAVPPLKGDPHRIGQVIQNLCTNAVQYTKEGGKVTIEVVPGPEWIVVGVRDTGIGISKEDLPRVWERFFQTKEAQTMRKAGFGLGLKIAREIVQMHGGDMGIESELGVGSFFYFKLPAKAPAAVPAPAKA